MRSRENRSRSISRYRRRERRRRKWSYRPRAGRSESHRCRLNAGVNPIRMQANIETPGALDLSIAVRTNGAGELHVDQAVMLRRPKALYVSVDPPNIDNALPGALTAAQFEVTRTDGIENTNFADYQLIVLNNWDLEKIAAPRKADLEKYVKQGGGLLVVGGERNVYDLKKKT